MTLSTPTVAERRDTSALLAGCHERWRRQRPNQALLTRADWQRLLPLVAQVHRHRPDLPLTALLTDRVASARALPAVLAWRLWQLLRQSLQQKIHLKKPPPPPTPQPPSTIADTADHYLTAVRTLGGPAAARAALATACHQLPPERIARENTVPATERQCDGSVVTGLGRSGHTASPQFTSGAVSPPLREHQF